MVLHQTSYYNTTKNFTKAYFYVKVKKVKEKILSSELFQARSKEKENQRYLCVRLFFHSFYPAIKKVTVIFETLIRATCM